MSEIRRSLPAASIPTAQRIPWNMWFPISSFAWASSRLQPKHLRYASTYHVFLTLKKALKEVKQAQKDQEELQHCFRTCFTSLTLVRCFPGFSLTSTQVRSAHSGPCLFQNAKLSAWHVRVQSSGDSPTWDSSGPSFQVALPPSAHVCPLRLLIPRVRCSGSVGALLPLPGALSCLHLVPPVPTQPGSLAAIHHPRQDHPSSFLCTSLGSAPNKAPISLFLSLLLCLLESRFRGPETSSTSTPWPNAWHTVGTHSVFAEGANKRIRNVESMQILISKHLYFINNQHQFGVEQWAALKPVRAEQANLKYLFRDSSSLCVPN